MKAVYQDSGRGGSRRWWVGVAIAALTALTVGCGDDSQIDAYERQRAAQVAASQRSQTSAPSADQADSAAGPEGPGAIEVERTGVVVPVLALDNTFRPEIIEIDAGDEVLWENRGQNEHDILSVEGTSDSTTGFGIELGKFGPGAVYSYVFSEPGEYRYYCTIHGNDRVGMIGKVVVK